MKRNARFLGARVAAGLFLALLSASAAHALVISEIMYHPAGAEPDLEFIELYNEDPDPLDLSGFMIHDAVDFFFPPETFLDGRSYLVVCANASAIRARYGIENVCGDYWGGL